MRGHERHIHVAGFLDGFAAIHAFEHGQFPHLFLDNARDAVKIFAPFAARHFAPDLFVGAAGGLDGFINVGFVGSGNFRELFFRGRVDGGEIFPGARFDEFAVDEQFMPRRDDVIPGLLRRGRVIPLAAEGEPAFLERHDWLRRDRGDGALGGNLTGNGFEFCFHFQSSVAADVRRLIPPSGEKVRASSRRLLRNG